MLKLDRPVRAGLSFVLIYLIAALPHITSLVRPAGDRIFPELWQRLSAWATVFNPGGSTYWAVHLLATGSLVGMKTGIFVAVSISAYFILGFLVSKYLQGRRAG